MRIYPQRQRKSNLIVARMESWIKGLNTLVSNTQIKANELSEAYNIQLVEDGKPQLPRDGQAYYGSESGTKVTGIFPYYQADGTKSLLRTSGTALELYNSGSWGTVSGYTYTTGLDTNGCTAYDRLYVLNGTDPLTYYNGTSITSFTAIAKPNAPTVTRTGTTGTYTFSYKISAVGPTGGETDPSDAGTAVANVATLDTNTFMTVAWSAVTNAVGYNVYGRKDGRWYFLTYLEGNGSVSYVDKNQDTTDESVIPMLANYTGGVKGRYLTVYKDTLIIGGDPTYPSRVYYSGGGDKINDFSAGVGGGFVDVSANDGQIVTGLIVFKDSLIIFKERSIYKFAFTTSGAPSLELINPAVGCIAPRSIIAVENDVFFASERGIFSIGNEAGYSFDVLRTNELSAKVRSIFQSINPLYISKISAIYATKSNTNLVIFSFTPSGGTYNSEAIVYDRERLGWLHWSNIQANCWTQYTDSTGVQRVLYGDDNSGYVKEILTGTDDFGSSIDAYFRIKAESGGEIERHKILKNVFLVLRKPSGNAITVNIIKDGTTTAKTIMLSLISPAINFGHYLFNAFLFKTAYGTGSITEQNTNMVRRITNINLLGRTFMLEFKNNATSSRLTLLSVVLEMKPKSSHYYQSGEVVN